MTIDPPTESPGTGAMGYRVNKCYCYVIIYQIVIKEYNFRQPIILLRVPVGNMGFFFFIHNKGQMYFPRFDEAFGSFYFYREISYPPPNYKVYHHMQSYRLERTHWKTLNTENQRCDEGNSVPNTTKCITRYLEQTVGCSMGLYGSDPGMKR